METNNGNSDWNEDRFGVQGSIQFVVYKDVRLYSGVLSALIKHVDHVHPWVSHYVGGNQAPSIDWMSVEAKLIEGDGEYVSRSYTIEIRPPFSLKATQFYPYHRYLNCLAEHLAKIGIEGVHSVRATMNIRCGAGSFLTPRAQRDLDETIQQPAVQMLKELIRAPRRR